MYMLNAPQSIHESIDCGPLNVLHRNPPIEKPKFLCTYSNQTKIVIWICTVRCQEFQISWRGRFQRCGIFSGNSHVFRMCDMTYSYVWHDSLSARVCSSHLRHLYEWLESFTYVLWFVRMRDMTHSYVWHALFVCVTWPIFGPCVLVASSAPICNQTHLYAWHDSFVCVT